MADVILDILQVVADKVPPQADTLRELDARIGDGDLGITVTRGFAAVATGFPEVRGKPVSDQLGRSGMAFNRAAASTFGVLFASAMMRGGMAVKGRDDVGQADIVPIARAAFQGLKDRGKANIGDKTLLDALAPAIDAFEEAEQSGKNLVEATDAAVEACRVGVKRTVDMQSKVSRASWLGERSIGVQDPGATAVLFILEAVQNWVHANISDE